jgi:hypothetical protein
VLNHTCSAKWTPEESENNTRASYPDFWGPVDLQQTVGMPIIASLPEPVTFQFQRAARLYAKALNFMPHEPELALVLLTSAVECLACCEAVFPPKTETELRASSLDSTCSLEESKTSRFCRFLDQHRPEDMRRIKPHVRKRFR